LRQIQRKAAKEKRKTSPNLEIYEIIPSSNAKFSPNSHVVRCLDAQLNPDSSDRPVQHFQ